MRRRWAVPPCLAGQPPPGGLTAPTAGQLQGGGAPDFRQAEAEWALGPCAHYHLTTHHLNTKGGHWRYAYLMSFKLTTFTYIKLEDQINFMSVIHAFLCVEWNYLDVLHANIFVIYTDLISTIKCFNPWVSKRLKLGFSMHKNMYLGSIFPNFGQLCQSHHI